jgi:hypothetical protein
MPLYCSISHSLPRLPSLCDCPVTHGCTLLYPKYASDTQIRIANIAITCQCMYKCIIHRYPHTHACSKRIQLNSTCSETCKGYYVNVATTCYNTCNNAAHTIPLSSNSPYSNGAFIISSSKAEML